MMTIVYAAAAMRHKLLICATLLSVSACAPKLGDDCDNAFDCSANNTRFCDRTQPGGYCTIIDCQPESCGDEGFCVRFLPDEPRLSRDWCMARCSNNGDCRDRYACRTAEELNEGAALARRAFVLDANKDGKFCVVRE